MAHHEPFDRAVTGWGALFSDLLSVGLLPRAVLRKLLGNPSMISVRAPSAGRPAHLTPVSCSHKGHEPLLNKTRWLLLKRPENLTEKQELRLADLVRYNLRAVRSYLLKEDFQAFWEYVSPGWAGKFLDRWCNRAMRSRLEPMKEVARMLRNHRKLLLNWFTANGALSSGTVEGFNNKARLTTRRAYGFRTYQAAEIALYHTLGRLPEPIFTHKFC